MSGASPKKQTKFEISLINDKELSVYITLKDGKLLRYNKYVVGDRGDITKSFFSHAELIDIATFMYIRPLYRNYVSVDSTPKLVDLKKELTNAKEEKTKITGNLDKTDNEKRQALIRYHRARDEYEKQRVQHTYFGKYFQAEYMNLQKVMFGGASIPTVAEISDAIGRVMKKWDQMCKASKSSTCGAFREPSAEILKDERVKQIYSRAMRSEDMLREVHRRLQELEKGSPPSSSSSSITEWDKDNIEIYYAFMGFALGAQNFVRMVPRAYFQQLLPMTKFKIDKTQLKNDDRTELSDDEKIERITSSRINYHKDYGTNIGEFMERLEEFGNVKREVHLKRASDETKERLKYFEDKEIPVLYSDFWQSILYFSSTYTKLKQNEKQKMENDFKNYKERYEKVKTKTADEKEKKYENGNENKQNTADQNDSTTAEDRLIYEQVQKDIGKMYIAGYVNSLPTASSAYSAAASASSDASGNNDAVHIDQVSLVKGLGLMSNASSSGSKQMTASGDVESVDCDTFEEEVKTFLTNSISGFNCSSGDSGSGGSGSGGGSSGTGGSGSGNGEQTQDIK